MRGSVRAVTSTDFRARFGVISLKRVNVEGELDSAKEVDGGGGGGRSKD